MSGWRLSKADGSGERSDLSLGQVSELLGHFVFGPDDLVAGPKQERMLRIGDVAALRKFLPIRPQADAPTLKLQTPASTGAKAPSARRPPAHVDDTITSGRASVVSVPLAAGFGPRLRPVTTQEEDELDLTAAIDVVFQLLIFFMVCGVIESSSNITLPRTKTGAGLDAQRCIVVGVRPGAPEDAPASAVSYFMGSQPDALLSLEEAAAQAAAAAQSDPSKTIVIKGAADAPNKSVLDLVVALKNRSADAILRTGVKEKHD